LPGEGDRLSYPTLLTNCNIHLKIKRYLNLKSPVLKGFKQMDKIVYKLGTLMTRNDIEKCFSSNIAVEIASLA